MYQLFRSRGIKVLFLAVILTALACSSTATTPAPSPAPAFDTTKAVLELQATNQSIQLTQAEQDLQKQQSVKPTEPPTIQPTIQPTTQPTNTPAQELVEIKSTPTQDFEARIKAAKILVYENTDEIGIGMWVQDALDGMGLKYTQTGSYSGHFMEYLDSGVKYDLIIVDAEGRGDISGEFWDVINTRLTRDKVALIAEMWYLHSEANGPISKILSGCGIRYQKQNPNADSVYWWEPENAVFNEPNTVLPLVHNYVQNWYDGDRIMLRGGGDATLLAGNSSRPQNDGGVLASCYQGRMIIQTFSDHNHPQSDIISLWQNYIHYTLKNHFAVTP